MKKIFIIALLLMSFSAAFLQAENRSPQDLPVGGCILYYTLLPHIEPLSREMDPPMMWDIMVGYQIYWQTSSQGNLEVAVDYDLKKNGNSIELFQFTRKNLYPNTLLKEELHAGIFPGGNTYKGITNFEYYHPGDHIPCYETADTKSIQPPR